MKMLRVIIKTDFQWLTNNSISNNLFFILMISYLNPLNIDDNKYRFSSKEQILVVDVFKKLESIYGKHG